MVPDCQPERSALLAQFSVAAHAGRGFRMQPPHGHCAVAEGNRIPYNRLMSTHLTTFEGSITDAIRDAITAKTADAQLEVTGGGGHFSIVVVSPVFRDKSVLESQRLVYSAIAHLMAGDAPPVHAVDRLVTRVPE